SHVNLVNFVGYSLSELELVKRCLHVIVVYVELDKQNEIVKQFKNMYTEINIDNTLMTTFLDNITPCNDADFEFIKGEIQKGEIERAITQLNRGKAPGPDGFPAELYMCFNKELSDLMCAVLNEGIKQNNMHDEFYEGIINLLYKKGDEYELNNWRQVTLMNIEYKIFAKVLMNRLEKILDKIINEEQTCGIKGRSMWDNLCIIRELITNKHLNESGFYILALDKKKAFDSISREYLWAVLERYNFPDVFIKMIKLLYLKSTVQVKVNGKLTEKIDICRGVKQGCPLSAALYVLAINPLLTSLKKEEKLTGVYVNSELNKYVVSAFADDITIFIKNQDELNTVFEHFKTYERTSGASLNQSKTEAVWIGDDGENENINIELKKEIKILGIYINNVNCVENNWSNWNISYIEKIELIKMFILSKLMFLSIVFPPPEKTITALNKLCIKTLWGNNREVTKRIFVYKSRENGGLGAFEIGDKLKISYCKHVNENIEKGSKWIGNKMDWEKIKCVKRRKIVILLNC
uniref:Reverse transcriptase domain-containing protein n=1 Tax=Astyanax mexicanus TaxID=7994 RepID=A0A3B1IC81_ASTMX